MRTTVLMAILLALAGCGRRSDSDAQESIPKPASQTESESEKEPGADESARVCEQLFQAASRGDEADDLWVEGISLTRFYVVKTWELKVSEPTELGFDHRYLVEGATKGGMPFTSFFVLSTMETDDGWRIAYVRGKEDPPKTIEEIEEERRVLSGRQSSIVGDQGIDSAGSLGVAPAVAWAPSERRDDDIIEPANPVDLVVRSFDDAGRLEGTDQDGASHVFQTGGSPVAGKPRPGSMVRVRWKRTGDTLTTLSVVVLDEVPTGGDRPKSLDAMSFPKWPEER